MISKMAANDGDHLQLDSPSQQVKSPARQSKSKKGYKRIKFKPWKPATESDTPENNSTRSKWRVNQKLKKSAIDSEVNSPDAEQRKALVKTAYTYRCPTPLQNLPHNGHRQDPFITLPIEATSDVTSALDFFLATCVPENRNSEWLVGKPNPHMALLFPFMLKSAMLFEIIITLCRGSILMAQGKRVSEDRLFVYRRAHAIKTITTNLTSPKGLSDASLLSVTMVLTLEYLTGNVAAVATHLEGLQQMLKFRDDLDGSTPWKRFVRAGMLAYQSLGCFVTGQPMTIPGTSPGYVKEAFDELALMESISYPELPFEPDVCTTLSRLPSGFAELSLSGNISKQVMKLLAFAQATTADCAATEEIDERIGHELQVILSALQRLSFMEATTIEKHLVCGLLGFTFQLRQLRSLNIFHDPPLRHFIDVLRRHEKPDSKRARDTMIWVSMAVAGALYLRTVVMPGSHQVMDRMFKLYPEATRWSYIESVAQNHFYTENILRHWEKCWSLGIERWDKVKNRLEHSEPILEYPGHIPQDEQFDDDTGRTMTFDDTVAHIKNAAYSLGDMMDAAKRCPFQARLASKNMSELDGMGSGICPMNF